MPDEPKTVEDEIKDFLEPSQVVEDEGGNDDEFFGRTDESATEQPEDGKNDNAGSETQEGEPGTPEGGEPADESDSGTPTGEAGETSGESESSTETPTDDSGTANEPEGDDLLTQLQEQNKLLLERIEELASSAPATETPVTETPTETSVSPENLTSSEPQNIYDFVGDEDLDEILADKDRFNQVISRAINTAINSASEGMLRAIPQVVTAQVKQQNTMQAYVDEFYAENKDLEPVKKTVAAVANTVHSENPDWSLDQIFTETASRTRKMLGLKRDAQGAPPASPSPDGVRPALPTPNKGGGRETVQPLRGQAKHINDVL